MKKFEDSAKLPWHQIYKSPVLAAKRQSKHVRKLKKIGLLSDGVGGSLLDVCCGEGEMLDILSKESFSLLAGVDLAERPPIQGAYYAAATAEKLPFRGDVFDRVLCAHALHHLAGVRSLESFLEEAWRCLKPGGTLMVIDHYDSAQLRFVFWMLRSAAARLLPWTRAFRQQLLAEHQELYYYLDHWKEIQGMLRKNRFQEMSYQQDAFFFYLTARKGLS